MQRYKVFIFTTQEPLINILKEIRVCLYLISTIAQVAEKPNPSPKIVEVAKFESEFKSKKYFFLDGTPIIRQTKINPFEVIFG